MHRWTVTSGRRGRYPPSLAWGARPPVLDRLRQEEGLFGFELDGQRFNISNAHSYSKTIHEFSRSGSMGVEAAPAAGE